MKKCQDQTCLSGRQGSKVKIFALGVFVIFGFMSSIAFAVSDSGLINSSKTLGYYLMPTVGLPYYSSGLVYNQKLTTTEDLEILYASFNSAFLITSNVTQLGVHKKWNWHLGILRLSALGGVGLMYSPAVGGGLTGDFGGEIAARLLDGLAVSAPIYVYLFNDGTKIDMNADINLKNPFHDKTEIFGGYRFSVSVLRSSSSSAATNSYYELGFRAGWQ
ncbi:MAG: hypothetical protein QME05_01605 [Candidatus Margulisbacteria bacterium]|nr:hypothetical protein [Candidatus Margulisiibacteriota bacterium]